MKHNAPYLTAIILSAAAFLTGCVQNESSAAEPVTEAVSSVTETSAVTTAESTEMTTTVTSQTTAAQSSASTTAAQSSVSTTASTAKQRTYAHRLALMNTSLGSRPVPEKYLDRNYSDTVPKRVQSALDAGRDMLGSCSGFCADTVHNCLYTWMYFGFGEEGAHYEYSFFRIDADTGKITGRVDTEGLKIGLRDVYGMFTIGGRLMLASYHGFYTFNDAFDEIIVLDPENEPLAGSTVICGKKVYLTTILSDSSGGSEKSYKIYDPAAGTLTEADGLNYPEDAQTVMEYLADQYRNDTFHLTQEETGSGETKLIFEWD